MNAISFLIATFGWSIVHSIWQIALISILVKVLLSLFSKGNSSMKYNIVLGGLFAAFMAFVITFYISADQRIALLDTHEVFNGASAEQARSLQAFTSPDTPLYAGGQNDGIRTFMQRIDGSLDYIVALWFAGFLFFLIRFLGGYLYIYRLRNIHSSRVSEKWQTVASKIRSGLNLTRTVTLMESAKIRIPIVIGHLKPAIILPLGLATYIPFNQLEAILVHEMAHIRRNDYLVNLFITSLEWIFFYHPLFWWLSRSLDHFREHCCDDITIAYCGKPDPLQKALLDLSNFNQKTIPFAAALYRNEYQLLNRIKRMKTQNQKNHGKRFNPAVLLLLPAIFIVAIAASSFTPRPGDMLHGLGHNEEGNELVKTALAEPESFTIIQPLQPLAIAPDTTKTVKKETVVKEFNDDGVINLELDAEGNLVSVKKDGKELTGKEKEKYERLANKLKQMKEEEKALEKQKEELERVKERLKETELKMKEVQEEYGAVMNDYMRIKSEAGWSVYEEAWGIHSETLMEPKELEELMERETDLAGFYNQNVWTDQFKDQEQWMQLQQETWMHKLEDSKHWEAQADLFEDQYRQAQRELEHAIEHEALLDALNDDMLLREAEEAEELEDLYKIDMQTRIFEEVVRQEMVKDGILDRANDKFSMKLTAKRLVVNGEKQNSDLHKKYLKIYNKYAEPDLSGDTRVIIED